MSKAKPSTETIEVKVSKETAEFYANIAKFAAVTIETAMAVAIAIQFSQIQNLKD